MDLAEELNDGKEIDWDDDNQKKYNINYRNRLEQDINYITKEIGQIYCLDWVFLIKAKERIGEDRLKKLFE